MVPVVVPVVPVVPVVKVVLMVNVVPVVTRCTDPSLNSGLPEIKIFVFILAVECTVGFQCLGHQGP